MNGLNTLLDSVQSSLTLDPSRARALLAQGNASQAIASVVAALRNPAQNPATALLALGLLADVLLIGMLVLWYVIVILPGRREDRAAAAQATTTTTTTGPEARRRRLILASISAGVVLAVAMAGWTYGTSDSACARCHYTAPAVASHAKASHSHVACSGCHVGPGVRNAFIASATGAHNVVRNVQGSTTPTPSVVINDSACLACHSDVTTGVVVARGIRMRHKDVTEVG
jgi:hypothetical protein